MSMCPWMTTGGACSPPPLPGRQITMLPAASFLVSSPCSSAKVCSRNACTLRAHGNGAHFTVAPGRASPTRAVCSHAHLCSCFEGRGISASMPKYFQSAAGSRSCTADEMVMLDMSAAAVLQASGQGGLRWIRGVDARAELVHGRAAITNGNFPTPEALTQAARHQEVRCT